MRLWRSSKRLTSLCSSRFLKRALLSLCLASTFACGQNSQKPTAKKAPAQRANELTLAGLRPGRDSLGRAAELNRQIGRGKELPGDQTGWFDVCLDQSLTIDSDKKKRIQVIRAAAWGGSTADCAGGPPSPWKTGHGLRVGDEVAKVVQLYGEAGSRSPSTRGGQPLELLYCAFDWACPEVPQL